MVEADTFLNNDGIILLVFFFHTVWIVPTSNNVSSEQMLVSNYLLKTTYRGVIIKKPFDITYKIGCFSLEMWRFFAQVNHCFVKSSYEFFMFFVQFWTKDYMQPVLWLTASNACTRFVTIDYAVTLSMLIETKTAF